MVLGVIERVIQYIIGVDDTKLYSLDHAILSMEVPPRSMWMNMGYWKVCKNNNLRPFSVFCSVFRYSYASSFCWKKIKTKILEYELFH